MPPCTWTRHTVSCGEKARAAPASARRNVYLSVKIRGPWLDEIPKPGKHGLDRAKQDGVQEEERKRRNLLLFSPGRRLLDPPCPQNESIYGG